MLKDSSKKKKMERKRKKRKGSREGILEGGILTKRETGLSNCLFETMSNLVFRTNPSTGNYGVTLGKLFNLYWLLFLNL